MNPIVAKMDKALRLGAPLNPTEKFLEVMKQAEKEAREQKRESAEKAKQLADKLAKRAKEQAAEAEQKSTLAEQKASQAEQEAKEANEQAVKAEHTADLAVKAEHTADLAEEKAVHLGSGYSSQNLQRKPESSKVGGATLLVKHIAATSAPSASGPQF